jgi:hypothetical protein
MSFFSLQISSLLDLSLKIIGFFTFLWQLKQKNFKMAFVVFFIFAVSIFSLGRYSDKFGIPPMSELRKIGNVETVRSDYVIFNSNYTLDHKKEIFLKTKEGKILKLNLEKNFGDKYSATPVKSISDISKGDEVLIRK